MTLALGPPGMTWEFSLVRVLVLAGISRVSGLLRYCAGACRCFCLSLSLSFLKYLIRSGTR